MEFLLFSCQRPRIRSFGKPSRRQSSKDTGSADIWTNRHKYRTIVFSLMMSRDTSTLMVTKCL